jgi:hypothetical protein
VKESEARPNSLRPRFENRRLYLGDMLLKHFTQTADGEPLGLQERLLVAFQERGWDSLIRYPFSVKGESVKKSLRQAVFDLNRRQKTQSPLRFKKGPTPEEIEWFLLSEPTSSDVDQLPDRTSDSGTTQL